MAALPNISKGRGMHFAALGAANDALIATPLETTGLESDAILADYDNLSAILAGASNEQTTLGRKTCASVTVTVDDTNNRVDADFADITWTGGAGNACSRLVISYDDDTTGGTDTSQIPLAIDDFVATPAGGDITYVTNAAGFLRAA